jgi:hypothetical protein
MKNILKLSIPVLIFSLLSGIASAQQRVVEESLVYDDPTVAKENKWVKGILLGYYYSNADSSVTNSSGTDIRTQQKFSQPAAQAFVGYGNFTLLGSYEKKNVTTSVPNSSASSSTTMKEDGNTYGLDFRYLAIPLQQKYFVPYALLSYVTSHSGVEFNTYSNGVQKRNFNHAKGPGIGAGGIIPLTNKFGFRVDIRQYQLKTNNTNNYSASIEARNLEYRLATTTAYYNLTEGVTLQLGGTYSYLNNIANSTSLGLNAAIGFLF